MVLHHISQLPNLIVVFPAPLNANRLGDRDLNMINARVVPLRINQPVGEP